MDEQKWIEQLRRNLEQKSTEELLQIWEKNDSTEWTDEAFIAIRQILEERGENPGPQAPAGSQAEPAQTSPRQRPGCVTAFVILVGIGVALSVLTSIIGVSVAPYVDTGSMIEIVITVASAILYGAIAVGLWQLKNWARIAVIVLLGLNLLLLIALLFSGLFFAVIGLLIGGYCLYWFAAHAEYFNPNPSAGTPPPTRPTGDSS
jgi:hypothetical protein